MRHHENRTLNADTTRSLSSRWELGNRTEDRETMNSKLIINSLAVTFALAYLQSEAVGTQSTIKTLDELPYDSENHLSSHVLAYRASCTQTIEASGLHDGVFSHKFYLLEGEASLSVFGHLPSSDCTVVCIEKGTPRSVVARPMPHRYWMNGKVDLDGDGNNKKSMNLFEFLQSDGCGKVEFVMINYLDEPVHIYWIGDNGDKELDLTLYPGEDKITRTFLGQKYEFYEDLPHDNKLENKMIQQLTVECNGVTSFGTIPHGHLSKEEVISQVNASMHEQWVRHLRVKRTFSPLGFEKGKLPNDLHASLASYYYNNRHPPHLVLEDWGNAITDITCNYWEADVEFVHIPPTLEERWQSRLKDLVEEWVGDELETTDMYGMRVYTNGARLLTHVDRVHTHAASIIVNVAQENVTRPWTIEVNDHANRLHEIVMAPGDIVYYESAKALHGRNTPLQGGKYVNLFTHYRPLNDPEWFKRENPEGTPQPLFDVGECKLVGQIDQCSKGAVKCDNDAIGIHLSPSMFQAKSGADLFHWWEITSPGNYKAEKTADGSDLEEL